MLTHSLTHARTHSLTHSLTHGRTHSLTFDCLHAIPHWYHNIFITIIDLYEVPRHFGYRD